ncbi:MAG: hypothetical protein FJZ92_09080, partial [Chloroflexi bacterium]|nr:hypothetical protein [Chloroflexota bacterium]
MPDTHRATPAAPGTDGDDFALAAALEAQDDLALAARATPLAPVVERAIAEAGGRIPFARFMELALGHPEHGYYAREGLAWGRDGDYETSPEVHPIFGFLWARQVRECWERLGRPAPFALVEAGAGSGAFAEAVLTWLRQRAPDCFAAARPVLLDGHPRRLAAQRARLQARGLAAEHALLDDWVARGKPLAGVALANEFFDALPVHLVERRGDGWIEWWVERDAGGALRFAEGPLSDPAIAARFEALGVRPGDGCPAEVSLAAPEAIRRLARCFERGYLLAIDYGYAAADLYAPWRRQGTLMAFRAHSPQPDPLASPGLLDLTAHVDLTTLAAAAAAEGWEA